MGNSVIICTSSIYVLFLLVLPAIDAVSQSADPRCYRPANVTGLCVPMSSNICLGVTLPFSSTSLTLTNDSNSLSEVYNNLRLWSGLKNVPQCWAVVQPFLCSVYLPRCDDSKGVELPVKELCERARKPCSIVEDIKGWPDFLQCDHPNFISGCKPLTYDKLLFNTTGQCEPPLVRTDDQDSWYEGVEGCGIPCDNPLFTEEQHDEVHIFIAVFGSICLLCTLFTVLTFIIDWKNANHYPAIILFFINACFFLGSIGWMSQFAGDARRDIVCRKDGTVRKGEPKLGSGESISCTMVFVIVYYFMVAGVSWFVMLAYAWYLTFTTLGTPRNRLVSKTAYFHLISWCSPLVLTIICLAISEIDGDSVSGICFVGGFNHGMRAMFVLVPVGLVIVVGTFFLLRGVYTLIKIRQEAPVFIPEKTCSKIRDTILRLGVFTAVALAFVFITFAVHVYIFANENAWKSSFREYMFCLANVSVTAESSENSPPCAIENRPSLVAMEIHIFAFFGAGIAMSSWSWTRSSMSAWERFFRWIFHKPSNKPVKLKRHRMIAQAFEKRKQINQGKVSISYCSSHDDPLGMKFDLNNGSDDELSSNFAMAMPKLVRRRGGLIYPLAGMGRRYSDSDVQSVISTRRVSRESQFLEFHEAQFVVIERDRLKNDPYVKKSRKKLKKKRGKLNRIRPILGPMFSGLGFHGRGMGAMRKESDSSVISQMSAQSVRVAVKHNSLETLSLDSSNVNIQDTILPAVTKSPEKDTPMLKNSSAIGGPRGMFSMFPSGMSTTDGSVVGGIGHASSGMDDVIPLPGAPEERVPSHQEREKKNGPSFEFPRNRTPLDSKFKGQKIEVKPEIHHSNIPNGFGQDQAKSSGSSDLRPLRSHHTVKSSSKSKSTTRRKSKVFTMESNDLSAIPFSPLMADIGGGNWGVLLGKSGSSSGSEAGGHSNFFSHRDVYMGGGHSSDGWGNNVPSSRNKGKYPPEPSHHSSRAKYGKSRSYQEPYYPQPHIGSAMDMMGGINPYLGGGGGANPYFIPPHAQGHTGYMGYMGGGNPYVTAQGSYNGTDNRYSAGGGARPKVHEDLGHFPAHCYYKGSEVEAKHKRRDRKGKREMKRPAAAFMNSTFEVEDDIESISA